MSESPCLAICLTARHRPSWTAFDHVKKTVSDKIHLKCYDVHNRERARRLWRSMLYAASNKLPSCWPAGYDGHGPCIHGRCEQASNGTSSCKCDDGWSGLECNLPGRLEQFFGNPFLRGWPFMKENRRLGKLLHPSPMIQPDCAMKGRCGTWFPVSRYCTGYFKQLFGEVKAAHLGNDAQNKMNMLNVSICRWRVWRTWILCAWMVCEQCQRHRILLVRDWLVWIIMWEERWGCRVDTKLSFIPWMECS